VNSRSRSCTRLISPSGWRSSTGTHWVGRPGSPVQLGEVQRLRCLESHHAWLRVVALPSAHVVLDARGSNLVKLCRENGGDGLHLPGLVPPFTDPGGDHHCPEGPYRGEHRWNYLPAFASREAEPSSGIGTQHPDGVRCRAGCTPILAPCATARRSWNTVSSSTWRRSRIGSARWGLAPRRTHHERGRPGKQSAPRTDTRWRGEKFGEWARRDSNARPLAPERRPRRQPPSAGADSP
jgi:hypothetical protein